jgi:hypothetical protein
MYSTLPRIGLLLSESQAWIIWLWLAVAAVDTDMEEVVVLVDLEQVLLWQSLRALHIPLLLALVELRQLQMFKAQMVVILYFQLLHQLVVAAVLDLTLLLLGGQEDLEVVVV